MNRHSLRTVSLAAWFAVVAATPAQTLPPVKKSQAGICHERGSPTYNRTTKFEAYDTLEACLSSGGRRAANSPDPEKKKSDSPMEQGRKILLGVAIFGAVMLSLWWLLAARARNSAPRQ